MIESLDLYDIGDKVILSGDGRYLDDAREIIESGMPSFRRSRKLLSHQPIKASKA